MQTTSLQASMLGRGVYERLGYELVCAVAPSTSAVLGSGA